MSPSTLLKDSTFALSPLVTGAVVAFAIFSIAKYLYRVTFHPLAAFPGPSLAALTNLYGAFYDLHPNRSYCKHFPALHDRYGPIVRLWPDELHIRDSDAYNQIFRVGSKFDKHAAFYTFPILEGSYPTTASNRSALDRKNMHSPLFSKEAVRRSEHLITDMLAKFLKILSGCASRASPVDLSMGFRCLAADVSMNYTFQRPLNALDAEGFQSEIVKASGANTAMFQWPIHFPKLFGGFFWVTTCLPRWFVSRFMKSFALIDWSSEVCREQIVHLQERSACEEDIRTVFDINFHPNPEKGQFTPTIDEMTADAFALLSAGTETTSHAMVVITWALLNNPRMMQRLQAELKVVMPSRNDTVGWAGLEELPYLRAVIREGLRLSYGAPGRLPRVVPSSGAVFCGQKIPAGTVVSSSIYVYHQDLHTFIDPETFRPERWLADTTSDPEQMARSLIPFSRGSRICTGMNVAYAELHLTLAHLFRRFEISNNGTSDADLQWKDCLVTLAKGDLKVMLKETVD